MIVSILISAVLIVLAMKILFWIFTAAFSVAGFLLKCVLGLFLAGIAVSLLFTAAGLVGVFVVVPLAALGSLALR